MKARGQVPPMPSALDEIIIKVPAPFAGVAELGFSARYPEQSLFQPLRDVPLWIEGPAEPMRRLADRLRMLAALVQAAHLRLTDRIEMRVRHADREVAELAVRWDQIVPANGEDLLRA